MKKTVVLLAILFASIGAVKADQLEWVSEEEARDAAQLLLQQKYVLLYCGCCGETQMQYVKLTNVSIKYTGYDNYYNVVVEGVDSFGNEVSKGIDLAYAHIDRKGKAICIGKALKLDCDPCVDKLPWGNPNF